MLFRNKKSRLAGRPSLVERLFKSQYIFFAVGLLVVAAISFPVSRNIRKQMELNKEINSLEKEIDVLLNKKTKLSGMIDFLGSDEFTQEKARLNLNLKKAGEEVAVITDSVNKGENSSPADTSEVYAIPGLNKVEPPRPESNPAKWLRYFFKPLTDS